MSTPLQSRKPRIAVTMGDPCGVGPEIIIKLYSLHDDIFTRCSPVVIGEERALQRAITLEQVDVDLCLINDLSELDCASRPGTLCVVNPFPLVQEDIAYGRPSPSACRATIQYIRLAAELALAARADAICTCPIHKANLQKQGFSFPGHTEFLQSITHADQAVMMLAGPRLRVSLVTIHHALADLRGVLTQDSIHHTISVTIEALKRDFGFNRVHVGVAGLNPHAGEQGRFGHEEVDLIEPVIRRFEKAPDKVSGPHSPDTVFRRAYEGEFDAVVAMYHDQGLIAVKMVHFHDAVNVTLGLPIIRTSVDHGTAYDLAGTGTADPGSLTAALHLAAKMARNRQTRTPNL